MRETTGSRTKPPENRKEKMLTKKQRTTVFLLGIVGAVLGYGIQVVRYNKWLIDDMRKIEAVCIAKHGEGTKATYNVTKSGGLVPTCWNDRGAWVAPIGFKDGERLPGGILLE